MKRQGHIPDGKVVGYPFCSRCGRIYLGNDVSRQAVREGCDPASVARRKRWNPVTNGACDRQGPKQRGR